MIRTVRTTSSQYTISGTSLRSSLQPKQFVHLTRFGMSQYTDVCLKTRCARHDRHAKYRRQAGNESRRHSGHGGQKSRLQRRDRCAVLKSVVWPLSRLEADSSGKTRVTHVMRPLFRVRLDAKPESRCVGVRPSPSLLLVGVFLDQSLQEFIPLLNAVGVMAFL